PPAPAPGTTSAPPGIPPAILNLPVGPSKLAMSVSDRELTLTGTINFSEQTYSKYINPRMNLLASQFQGQMRVFSGAAGRRTLAPVVAKLAQEGQFPRGAVDRPAGIARYGLQYPASSRVSFFASLLPHLGRGDVAIDSKLAWYDPQNLGAADEWVPEFLVP